MADPIDPVQQLESADEAMKKAKETMGFFGEIIDSTKNRMNVLSQSFQDIQNTMDRNDQMTMKQANTFGFLATQVVGVSRAFDGFHNIDTSGLNTIESQLGKFKNSLEEMPIYTSKIRSGMEDLAGKGLVGDAFEKAKEKVIEGAKKAAEGVYEQMLTYAKSADNIQKLRNAMIQLGSQSGDLGGIWQKSGADLQNLNQIVAQQDNAIQSAGLATHKTKETMAAYYSILGQVPQALTTLVSGTDGAEKSTSMLVATTQLATGTGRNYSEVVKDIQTAFDNYNLTGDDALKFTARISELSQKYGIELSNVRDTIIQTSNAFKMFGNEGEGASRIMNNYIGAFKETGISGTAALSLVNQMTDGIKGMSIQQKAFLSLQTGGAGGLLGGFQIEQMFREDKLDEILEKVRNTMKKQLGGIKFMGLEDVKTEGDAAQFQKQVMMLQQGPLGKFAQDPQSAYRILEGFRNKDEGRIESKDLSENFLQDTMKRGQDINAQSNTALFDILQEIEGVRTAAEQIVYNTTQDAFSQKLGFSTVDSDAQDRMRMRLQNKESANITRSGDVLKSTDNQIGTTAFHSAKEFMDSLGGLGTAAKSSLQTIEKAFISGDKNEAKNEFEKRLKTFDNRAIEAQTIYDTTGQKNQLQNIAKEREAFESGYQKLQASSINDLLKSQQSAAFTNARFPDVHLRNIGVDQAVKEKTTQQVSARQVPVIADHRPNQELTINVRFSGEVGAANSEIEKTVKQVVDGVMDNLHRDSRAPGTKNLP